MFILPENKLNLKKEVSMNTEILHDEKNNQFYLLSDNLKAYVSYEILEGRLFDLQHTVVPKALSGRGLAASLVESACNYARSQGMKIRATCAYAKVWLERHPGYDYEAGDCGDSCPL